MKGLLRPILVGGLSIAIAAANLVGSSSVAFAAGTKPAYTSLSVPGSVSEGDKPTVTGTFTDPDLADQHTVQISWGDGSMDFYTLVVGDRSFSLQKSVGYPNVGVNMTMQITLSDGSFSVSRFPTITVDNVAPSITSFSVSSTDLNAGSAVTATGGFDDPGTGETHTVTVSWGDGTANTVLNLARRVWAFTTPAHTYTAGGTFTVTATVADNAGGSAVATATITVHSSNQAPSVVSFGVTGTTEGGSSTLSLNFSDADASDTHAVSVVWGDGTTTGPVSLDSTVTTYSTTHVYADTGTYAVGLTLDDNAGHSVTAAASVSATNVAPTFGSLALTPASFVDHQTVTLSGDFVDPGTADTFTLTIDWGDGTSSTQSLAAGTRTFSATHAYDAAGPFTISATVTDRDNGPATSTAKVDVLPSNHAPADLVVQATALLEGGSTTLNVSFTDAELSDTHTLAINWGDGSTGSVALAAGATSSSSTHTYLETGTYTVAVTVTDSGTLSVAGGTTATATNVSPSLSNLVFTPSSVTDHQTVTVSGTFVDPGTTDTYTVAFAWGDGTTSSQSLVAGVRSYSGSHDYATSGTYAVSVTVTDRDTGADTKSGSLVVTARNTAPSGLSLSKNVTGLSATVSGTFADPDPLDSHDVTMVWGDGTTSSSTLVAGATLFSATHTYLSAGTFTVTVTVTDPAAASTSGATSVVVTAAASTVSDVLDQMAAFVESLGLSPNTERWLLRKIDDLRASAAGGGNAQLCASAKVLGHLSAYAGRVLTNDQAAALDSLGKQLETAAGCAGSAIANPKVQKTTRVTTTVPPTQKKETTTNDENKGVAAKSDKSDKTEKSDKVDSTKKSGTQSGSSKEGRNSR